MVKKFKKDFQKIDFIFYMISSNENLTITTILEQFEWELAALKIDSDLLINIIDHLIKDGFVIQTATKLKLTIDGENFSGYQIQYESEDEKYSRSQKREYRLKVITILVTIIFGVISSILLYLSYLSYKEISAKDKIIQEQKSTIDSLNKKVLLKTH